MSLWEALYLAGGLFVGACGATVAICCVVAGRIREAEGAAEVLASIAENQRLRIAQIEAQGAEVAV